MKLEILKPSAVLSKAYKKSGVKREQFELFKTNLVKMFNRINENESEENLKNILADFLKDTFYKGIHEINTKGRQDLAIHNDNSPSSSVGVIIEVKRPSNSQEMISPAKPNSKALHELLLYFLQERFLSNNKEIKHLIVTNLYQWYLFDIIEFEKAFAQNKVLVSQFKQWSDGSIGLKQTKWFYDNIALPFLEEQTGALNCVLIDLKDALKIIEKDSGTQENLLLNYYRILSPFHILKKPAQNDSNTLNREFYNELLHIIGVEEAKVEKKRIIRRKPESEREEGSLLENTINILKIRNKLNSIESPEEFGETEEEQLFSIALELNIAWINRILFLKLLDGQLALYHKGENRKPFLSETLIRDFDELNELFFEVLAIPLNERSVSVNKKFGTVPFLNSSLFEETFVESKTIVISDLKDRLTLSVYKGTVLKDSNGRRLQGNESTLSYLFKFLDSYDFASDISSEIQEQNKTLINASVLGLIFEKINGYKDGSVFTPGFVTSYMTRRTIREAVIDSFNQKYGWGCRNFTELYNNLDKVSILEANKVIDNLKICDPAVGSGHFLVSALNEIIAVKSDLGILTDNTGKRLRGYTATVENDELIISYEDEIFTYNYKDPESRRIQETIFLEKQKIIENSLFGVDLNPKSVLICRLRLWIELLKNTFYTARSNFKELETLPNIDINIKRGNSLISRFNIADDYTGLPQATHQKIKIAIQNYKDQVALYKATNDKSTKHRAQKEIERLKERFSTIVDPKDGDYQNLKAKEMELAEIPMLFTREEKEAWEKKIQALAVELQMLEDNYSEKLKNVYGNAFEWRFEFPEVLDDNGNFIGFDVVIGNPPYIQLQKMTGHPAQALKDQGYESYEKTGDIYTLFYELGIKILRKEGKLCYISGNSWMRAGFGKKFQKWVMSYNPELLVNLGPDIFETVTIDTAILIIKKGKFNDGLLGADLSEIKDRTNLDALVNSMQNKVKPSESETWFIGSSAEEELNQKIKNAGIPLSNWDVQIYRGVLTGLNEAFIIDDETREKLIRDDPASAQLIKPLLRGRDLSKFWSFNHGSWLLATSFDLDVETKYKAIFQYLNQFREKAERRDDQGKNWYNLRACAYYDEFSKPKVVWKRIGSKLRFSYDTSGSFCLDSTCIMTGEHLKYLCAYLNSKVAYMLLNDNAPKTGVGDMIISVQALEPLHVPPVTAENKSIVSDIEALVDNIIAKLKNDPESDITTEENRINDLVYSLFDLTPEEIEIVERKNGKLSSHSAI